VHARKAWLKGLSPKQNRHVPPLDYQRVRRLKRENPERFIGLNGGLSSLDQAVAEMDKDGVRLDGVMFGRAAYHNPGLLRDVDRRFYGDAHPPIGWDEVIARMSEHAGDHLAAGGRLHHVTRHMIGLFAGMPGARRWRQILATESTLADAGVEVIGRAFAAVELDGARQAA